MRKPSHALAILLVAGLLSSTAFAQSSAWVDRLTEKWNVAGAVIAPPPPSQEASNLLAMRCAARAATGNAANALAQAGWVPFLHLDRTTTRDDIEVIGGMAAANTFCEPTAFNLFVFVGGRFAGTLSPAPMTPAHDGAAGAVRLAGPDAIATEFARYMPADTECCPSSVVRVTYRVNRVGPAPQLEAVETRRVR
jgi:hypothetical protein